MLKHVSLSMQNLRVVSKMTTIHLLVEDEYLQTLMQNLPKDKVHVIEAEFGTNSLALESSFSSCVEDAELKSYSQSMREMSSWLQEREN